MAHPPSQLLAEYPVVITIPVQWGEMDAYGHVNNAVFFRYFESARIAYFERCGFLESMERDGVGAILHSTACRFRAPLFYQDTVDVGARVRDLSRDRFTMEYRVVSRTQGVVAGDGHGVIVAYDYAAGQKTALPDAVQRQIAALERGGGGG